MSHANFVHLRVHSAYSLSEGAIRIKELVKLCVAHGMPAVAVTDSGNLFGALEFALAAREAGVQPIVGCQLAMARPSNENGNVALRPVRQAPDQLVLLVQNETGYANLLKLVSRAFLEGEAGSQPQLAWEALDGLTDGLIAFTGGPHGLVGRLLHEGQKEAAETALLRLAGLFPDRLYMELMRHGLAIEQQIEPALLDLAYAHDIPLVATNEVFFADADMFEAHDALLCIAGGAYVTEETRRRETPEHRFKSAAEMRALFADLPEAVDNTMVIVQRCAFMPAERKPILPAFPTREGRSAEDELRAQAAAGLEERLAVLAAQENLDTGGSAFTERATPYRQRLAFELETIIAMGFAGYFLIVADFIQWAKRQGIPVGPGRGSGAGSVAAWALTITDLDPTRWGLLFERFLNPERVSMPDFDIDFCQDRRDEVIRYVQEKYGRDRVAQIITFGKLQARAALRDVGRVVQMPYGQVDRICKLVPNNPANPVTIAQAIEGEPQLQTMQEEDPSVARLIDIAIKLEGLYRHASTHAAGVVIGDRPLNELVPLYRDPRSDMPVTQFSMKYVELAGLVKFDFLGLKTLTVLAKAQALLSQRGVTVDLENLPLDDAKTYEMIGRGESTGIFQLESSGMRDVLRKLKPDRFEDIIAVVALYRPGPMDNIPRYIACKHGTEQPDYLHPSLEGILRETYGIAIYQEQVMQIAQALSGYSLGGADLLRRAMGKKIKSEMEAQRKAFTDGALARGVQENTAAHIFHQVEKFAGYGFNKSHAAAYALVAYQTAWMKANYPVEFFAALMTLDIHSSDKLNLFRQELERMGFRMLAPDINRSGPCFTVEPVADGELAVRYALAAIKNVGAGAMEAMTADRDANGPFKDIGDLSRRLDPRHVNKRPLENLIRAGALDSLDQNRRRLFESSDVILRHANAEVAARESNQTNLFGDAETMPSFDLPPIDDWLPLERLQHEFEAIGFYISAHPLDSYVTSLRRLDVTRFADLATWLQGRPTNRARLAGIVISRQERTSARGNRFAFVQFSDSSGVFEATVFSDQLFSARQLLEPGRMVVITADARHEEDSFRLTLQTIEPIDEATRNAAAGLKVFLNAPGPLESLKQIIAREGKGKGRINLVLDLDGAREVEMALPGGWAVSPAGRAAIKAIPGVVEVQEI
ncbi:MAG: DNA polymerase III subunit alpha [Rhodospirillaceae bacterium]|nr:DNA polymerase III subunit alpha [Rhodospirillaceae bacterium]